MRSCARMCVYAREYNATHFGYDTFLVHSAFSSDWAVSRRRIAVLHMTSLLSCRKMPLLILFITDHFSVLLSLLLFVFVRCLLRF